jgi:hypothetical protein
MLVSRKLSWVACILILLVLVAGCSPAATVTTQAPAVTAAPALPTEPPPTQAVPSETPVELVTEAPVLPTEAPVVTEVLPTEAPVLDGAALLESRCTACHNLDRVKQAKKTQAQWESTVNRMIQKGAQLTDAEKAILLQYLAQTFGQ